MTTNTQQPFVKSSRRLRAESLKPEMSPVPAPASEKPKDGCPIDAELGEHDACFTVLLQGFRHTGRIINLRAVIVVPMALNPVFFEEGQLQLRTFLENSLRIAQIALNDYLDKHVLPPPTPDGKVALDMNVKLPSAGSPQALSPAEPQVFIKPAPPDTEGQPSPYATTKPDFVGPAPESC